MKKYLLVVATFLVFFSCGKDLYKKYSINLENFKTSRFYLENNIPVYLNTAIQNDQRSSITVAVSFPSNNISQYYSGAYPELYMNILLNYSERVKKKIITDFESSTGSTLSAEKVNNQIFFTVNFANAYFYQASSFVKEAILEQKQLNSKNISNQIKYLTDTKNTENYKLFYSAIFKKLHNKTPLPNYEILLRTSLLEIETKLREITVPANLKLFVSGNLNPEIVFSTFQNSYGTFPSRPQLSYIREPQLNLESHLINDSTIYLPEEALSPYEDIWLYEGFISEENKLLYYFLDHSKVKNYISLDFSSSSSLYALTSEKRDIKSDLFIPDKNTFLKRKEELLSEQVKDFSDVNKKGFIFFTKVLSSANNNFYQLKKLNYKTYRKRIEKIKIEERNYSVKRAGIAELYKPNKIYQKKLNNRQIVISPDSNQTSVFFLSKTTLFATTIRFTLLKV